MLIYFAVSVRMFVTFHISETSNHDNGNVRMKVRGFGKILISEGIL